MKTTCDGNVNGKEHINIKYFSDQIDKLTYIDGKSDWIDLRAAEDVVLKRGEFKLNPHGVAMELPKAYEAHVVHVQKFRNYTDQSSGGNRRLLLRGQ